MTAATNRRNRRANTRARSGVARASRPWTVRSGEQGGNPRTIAYDAADRITTDQEGSALTTLAWQSRGAMHTQKTGTDTTTFTYSDPMFLTAVDGPSGRLATYVYDSESKRRRIYEGAAFTTIVWDGWDYLQWRRPSGTHVFHTMNGEIVGESVGGTVRDYLLDPLGSVVATLDSGGIVDQFEYWPYGELVDDLPEGAPVFLWVGGLGYWFDTDDRRYVRHRMLRTDLGSWMQLDLNGVFGSLFEYVDSSPIDFTDYLGLAKDRRQRSQKWQRGRNAQACKNARAFPRPPTRIGSLFTVLGKVLDISTLGLGCLDFALEEQTNEECTKCCTAVLSVLAGIGGSALCTPGGPIAVFVCGQITGLLAGESALVKDTCIAACENTDPEDCCRPQSPWYELVGSGIRQGFGNIERDIRGQFNNIQREISNIWPSQSDWPRILR